LKLWSGESISLIGAQVTRLALPLTAVYQLNASPVELGILNAASFAPFLGLTLFIGVWVDRRRRKGLMIWSNVGRAALVCSVPLCYSLGILHLGYLYVAALGVGVLTVVFDISYQSYLPTLISRDHLIEGNAKLQTSSSVSEVGGPGLAGLLVGWFSAPTALLLDGASYLVSALSLRSIRKPEPAPERPAERVSTLDSLKEGMRVVLGNAYLRACALEAGTYNFCWMALQTVFLLYAARELRMSPSAIGLLFAVAALGALLGALSATWFKRRLGLGRAIIVELVVCCCAPILIPLAPNAHGIGLTMMLLGFTLCQFGATMATIHVVSLRQVITPDRILGRVNAGCRFLAWGPLPLGSLFGGLLATYIGLRPTLFVAAALFMSALLWVWFSPVRLLKDFSDAQHVSLASQSAEPPEFAEPSK
jgi:MFS family permease